MNEEDDYDSSMNQSELGNDSASTSAINETTESFEKMELDESSRESNRNIQHPTKETIYLAKLHMLFYQDALCKQRKIRQYHDNKSFEKFGNFIIEYNENKYYLLSLLQANDQLPSGGITMDKLLSIDFNEPFSLLTYFKAFLKVLDNIKKTSGRDKIFIIPIDVDNLLSEENHMKVSTNLPQSKCYKFKDITKEMDNFKYAFDTKELAKILNNNIKKKQNEEGYELSIDCRKKNFVKYKEFLMKYIFATDDKGQWKFVFKNPEPDLAALGIIVNSLRNDLQKEDRLNNVTISINSKFIKQSGGSIDELCIKKEDIVFFFDNLVFAVEKNYEDKIKANILPTLNQINNPTSEYVDFIYTFVLNQMIYWLRQSKRADLTEKKNYFAEGINIVNEVMQTTDVNEITNFLSAELKKKGRIMILKTVPEKLQQISPHFLNVSKINKKNIKSKNEIVEYATLVIVCDQDKYDFTKLFETYFTDTIKTLILITCVEETYNEISKEFEEEFNIAWIEDGVPKASGGSFYKTSNNSNISRKEKHEVSDDVTQEIQELKNDMAELRSLVDKKFTELTNLVKKKLKEHREQNIARN